MRDPSYEAIRVEAKSVMASYDDLTVQCLAEYRSKDGVRIMMKFKAPNGKVSQAGSHVFPTGEDVCCSRYAYLYMDMLRLLIMFWEHEQANLAVVQARHSEVKTYMSSLTEL